jgi:hypothetical protein
LWAFVTYSTAKVADDSAADMGLGSVAQQQWLAFALQMLPVLAIC